MSKEFEYCKGASYVDDNYIHIYIFTQTHPIQTDTDINQTQTDTSTNAPPPRTYDKIGIFRSKAVKFL